MRLSRPAASRILLFLLLLVASAAVLYTTDRNARAVRALAARSLASTATALSAAAEAALRAGVPGRAEGEVREILSDRVVAYALIAREDGTILFHTNPALAGSRIPDPPPPDRLASGTTEGRRVTLGTGLPAYEVDHVLHRTGGGGEFLRIVLHTTPADRIVAGAERMWWTVGFALLLLWTVGILLERTMTRRLRAQAEADRRERMALIGQMTAQLAHEVRNALGSIKGFAQWVDEKVPATDARKAGLSGVLRGTARIETLVDDLLLFSREDAFRIERVDVAALARDAVVLDLPPWKGEVDLDLQPGLCAAADPEKLRRVLANGLRNAVQAMGEDGRLRVSAHREGRWAAVRIADTGPGIPEDEAPRLFTPFHTTKPDGTGLGLAYSKKAVDGMGGRIDLANRGGGGAVLTVRLPAQGD